MLIALALVALLVLPMPWGLVAVAGAAILEVLEFVFWKRFLRRYQLRVGPETLIGEQATVVVACAPVGRVRIRGELWNARSTHPVEAGQPVVVAAVDGLTLEVEPGRSSRTEKGPGEGPLVSEGRAASDAAAGPSVLKSLPLSATTRANLTPNCPGR